MDIRNTLVAQNYAANLTATSPTSNASAKGSVLGAADDFVATLRRSEQTALTAMTAGADPHALVQALAQTELAVQTAVTVRNKVVEAYQEILRMPV